MLGVITPVDELDAKVPARGALLTMLRVLSARRSLMARPMRTLCPPTPALLRQQRRQCSEVSFTFVEDGEEIEVTAKEGRTLLEAAHDNDIDLEGPCCT